MTDKALPPHTAPYREASDLQNKRNQYINSIDRAQSQYKLRERIMMILMISPVLLTIPTISRDLVPYASYFLLAVPLLFMLMRAKEIDVQVEVLKSLRKGIEGLSLERQDDEQVIKQCNKEKIDVFGTKNNSVALPVLITFCSAMIAGLYSTVDSDANPHFILGSGFVALIAIAYNAFQLKKAQAQLRSKLAELLPYVAHDNGVSLNTPIDYAADEESNTTAPVHSTGVRVDTSVTTSQGEDEFAVHVVSATNRRQNQ